MSRAPGVNCVKANEFLRRVDAYLAMQQNTAVVSCDAVLQQLQLIRNGIRAKALATDRKTLADLVDKTYALMADHVECRGDTMVNVGAFRMYIDRIRCVPSVAKSKTGARLQTTKLILGPQRDYPYPVPTGFVKPRILQPEWTARQALADGWVRHPVYDWIMPINKLLDTPMPRSTTAPTTMAPTTTAPATTAPVPLVVLATPTHAPTTVPAPTNAPVDITTTNTDPDDLVPMPRPKKKKISARTWIYIGISIAVIALTVVGLIWWLKSRHRGDDVETNFPAGYSFVESPAPMTPLMSTTAMERAFAGVPPPSPNTMTFETQASVSRTPRTPDTSLAESIF